MPININLSINGRQIRFYVYSDIPNPEQKITNLTRFFSRIPDQHLNIAARTAYFVVDRLVGGRDSGGGTYHSISEWRGRSYNTGISDAEIDAHASTFTGSIIGLTKKSFLKNIFHFTVLHETAHAVDHEIQIYPPEASLHDYLGMTYPNPRVGELAAEVYSRYIICRWEVYEFLPPRESAQCCNCRLISLLMRSPAGAAFGPFDLQACIGHSTC